MPNKKARRIDSIPGKLELFFGILLLIAGIAACVTLFFIAALSSGWIALPIILLIVSPCIIGHALSETAEENKIEIKRLREITKENESKVRRLEGESEEDYQKAVELNNTLEKLHHYGKGEKIPEENSALFKQLKASQTAHFMLSLKAEIESEPKKSPVLTALKWISSGSSNSAATQQPIEQSNTTSDTASDNFENAVVSLLEEADAAFPSTAKSSDEILEDKSVIFKSLFTGILDKTEITRKVFTGTFNCKISKDKPIYQSVTKRLALFGINPDGQCVDYAMGMYSREDTWEAITPYRNNESFKEIMLFEMDDHRQIPGFDKDPTIKKLSEEFNSLQEISSDKRTIEQKKRWEELNTKIDTRKKEVVHYEDDEKFMTFFKNKMQHEWLSSNFFGVHFCNLIKKDGKMLLVWNLHNPNDEKEQHSNPEKAEIYHTTLNPGPQKHYLHEMSKKGGKHCNRLVEIDDFEGLIDGKRHENRFGLCQTQEAYERYRATWVRP